MKKILILGAGITGLSATWKLSEKGYDVEILEMDSLVGGLAKTIKFKNSLVDIGPHSFFSENKEIYDTVKSLFKDEPQESVICSMGDTVAPASLSAPPRIWHRNSFPGARTPTTG